MTRKIGFNPMSFGESEIGRKRHEPLQPTASVSRHKFINVYTSGSGCCGCQVVLHDRFRRQTHAKSTYSILLSCSSVIVRFSIRTHSFADLLNPQLLEIAIYHQPHICVYHCKRLKQYYSFDAFISQL